jgi:uncharacterized protein with NAD-binding domain and iron-sulfur cluster
MVGPQSSGDVSRFADATGNRAAPAMNKKVRVAIVGGGCAGLTTAFELTRPEHQGRFDVTVYQMGFRLGGKGASGRGPGARIEEHGLHLWLGFYENAFRVMRDCYAELGRERFRCPIATFEDAFKPAPFVAVTDRDPHAGWVPWVAHFPASKGVPGDPLDEHNPFSIAGYLSRAAALVVELLRSAASLAAEPVVSSEGQTAEGLGAAERAAKLTDAAERLLRHGQVASATALIEGMDLVCATLGLLGNTLHGIEAPLLALLGALSSTTRRQLERVVSGNPELKRVWQVIDLILAVVRGSLAHGLVFSPEGFDAVDDYDWREWLALHGAAPESLASGFMRGIYDLAFAYQGGDPERPRLSAAAALRGAMRMFFTYRGTLFWRMSAGMGDVVFAPLYEVLKRRGVRFEFFHRLERAVAAEDRAGRYVSELHFAVQAEIRGGAAYRPLVDVHGVPSWPARPDYEQLVGGEQAEREGVHYESPWEARVVGHRTLQVARDFDFFVLALGGGAVAATCVDLCEKSTKWRQALSHLNTVATQALQLWLTADTRQLGWPHPPVNLSGWVEPFDTWADMSHLIPAEDFASPVGSIAYFCSPLPDPRPGGPGVGSAFEDGQREVVRRNALAFLSEDLTTLWPRARDAAGRFRWELLVAARPEGAAAVGPDRLDTQFWTANVRPSERYVLSLPGTSRYRLSPLDRSFDNATVAGDWTASGLNTGCVESAVISGRLAAHALSGLPALKDIIGYDHP